MTNRAKLEEVLVRSGLKNTWICDQLGISYTTWWNKRLNHSEFTASEIVRLKEILNLTDCERDEIFFDSQSNDNGQEGV